MSQGSCVVTIWKFQQQPTPPPLSPKRREKSDLERELWHIAQFVRIR